MNNRFIAYIRAHKVLSSLGLIAVLLVGYYGFFRKAAVLTEYTVAQAQTGTLVATVTGTGQISASSEVTISPQVSGLYTYVNTAIEGTAVASGTEIAQVDPTDAEKAVRSAQLSLQDAQLSLQKLQAGQTTDQPKLQDTITTDQDNLTKDYQTGFSTITSAFINLPSTLNDTRNVLYANALNSNCEPDYCGYENLVDLNSRNNFDLLVGQAISDYDAASASYGTSFADYQTITHTSDPAAIDRVINETLQTSQLLSQAIKSEQTMLDTLVANVQAQINVKVPTAVTQNQNTLNTDSSTANTDVSNLLNMSNTITNDQQSLTSDQQNLTSTQTTDPLDLQSQENAVAQAQEAVVDAQTTLGEYTIRAPFDGIIADIAAEKGAEASGTAATIISSQQIAELTLNEVDVAKIALGEEATLTFDAIPNLTLTGKVVSIDTIGTVTQGVVSYTVKIALDTQNTQVKPGMSVSAAIITQEKANVIEIPSGAIKTANGQSYVQTVTLPASLNGQTTIPATSLSSPPTNVTVTTGISNATMTEITSGLNAGDTVIIRTSTNTTTAAATSTSAVRIPGLTTGGAGGAATFGGGGAGRTTTTTTGR